LRNGCNKRKSGTGRKRLGERRKEFKKMKWVGRVEMGKRDGE